MSNEMPDSTKELLTANHASILRELSAVNGSIIELRRDMRVDIESIRDKFDVHSAEDHQHFGTLDTSMGVLKLAYGLGVVLVGVLVALLKLGVL